MHLAGQPILARKCTKSQSTNFFRTYAYEKNILALRCPSFYELPVIPKDVKLRIFVGPYEASYLEWERPVSEVALVTPYHPPGTVKIAIMVGRVIFQKRLIVFS